ncbi:MAG: transposase family protein [Deltaproteobacteria bacterium]|nr:transposase family protein [Deltaproteobacteria bacterium]
MPEPTNRDPTDGRRSDDLRRVPATPAAAIASLHSVSSTFPDWRGDQGKRHVVGDGIAVVVLAVIAGAQDAEHVAAFGKAKLAWLRPFFRWRPGHLHTTSTCG